MLVGAEAEVLDGLTGVLGATEEDDVRASRGTEGQLVESQALTTGLLNASAGSGSEAKRSDGELRDLVEAVVIGDGANNCPDLSFRDLRVVLVGGDSHDL